ncbi:c-type cytochrome [Myxococcus eversor]|uniref:c-type cytochrome n=1 Tax=Myxococcus eversor TaxID=2709661 RepID=UPI0013D6009A|nr:c-type cytochrome [Myxococcus eversor]
MHREVRGTVKGTLLLSLLLAGCAGTVKAPYPPIRADTSPAALARGAAIFHASCEACHRGGDTDTASGAPLHELPSYMGSFHSSNLTSHPTAGIGAAKDEELARAIRYAVSRDGRLMVMPSYGMGDKDLAAVLGFLRSGDPLFKPDATPAPRSEFSFIGGLGFRVIMGNEPVQRPPLGIPVPPKAPTVEYGRYMAHDVYDCASCHTPGFSPNKTEGDDIFEGGMAFKDPEGRELHSSNITFHATGLAYWTQEDFSRAVRDGIAPDGSPIRSPMPRFRGMDEEEAKALYEYLRSVPPLKNDVDGARPRLTATTPRPDWVATPATAPGEVAAEAATTNEPASADATGPGVATPTETPSSPTSVATGAGTTQGAVPSSGSTQTSASPAPRGSESTSVATNAATPKAPRKPRLVAARIDAPKVFTQLGCAGCHAPGARYHDRLARAPGRSEAELVRWVRNPEKFLPGTPMPTYAELLDEATALALVRWVKAGGPATLAPVSH